MLPKAFDQLYFAATAWVMTQSFVVVVQKLVQLPFFLFC